MASRFQQLYDFVEVNKPHTVLEIGTWNGHNATRLLTEGAKKYIGFDLWEDGNELLDELENNAKKRVTVESVREFLKSYDVELIKGNTRETLKAFVKDKKPFVDLAVIDGGHSTGTRTIASDRHSQNHPDRLPSETQKRSGRVQWMKCLSILSRIPHFCERSAMEIMYRFEIPFPGLCPGLL